MRYAHWIVGLALALAVAPALAADTAGSKSGVCADLRAEMNAKRAELFAQADADGDGALSREEFATFEKLLRAAMQDRHFSHVDADQNGKVTLAELSAARPPRCFHGGPFGR